MIGALLVFVAMLYGLAAVILPPEMMIYPATPIFFMVGLILWLMPDLGGIQYDRMQAVMIPFLSLSIFWPNYVAFNLPGLPWISPTRGALFVVLAIFIWNFSTSREMRDAVRDSFAETPLSIRAYWLFWATTTFSLIFSNNISQSINKYLNNQVYWTMVLLVTALLATRPGFVSKVGRTIVIASCVVIVYSLYEYHIQRVPWIDYLPSFLKVDPELLDILMRTQARAGTEVYRVRGPYAAALYFSEFLTMAYPFLLHFTFKEPRRLPAMALGAATFGCIAVMIFTDARSAMIGLLVASVLYIFYSALRERTLRPRSIMGTGVLIAYPVGVAILFLVVWFWRRAHVMVLGGGQHAASSGAREIQWAMAWPKIATHPFGHGVQRGGEALGYTNPGGVLTVDSYFMTIMLDSGYLALPLFLLTFLLPAWTGFKYHRTSTTPEAELLAPLSLTLINFTIVKSVLSSEASVSLAFICIGCIFGLVWQRNRGLAAEAAAVSPVAPRTSRGSPVLAATPARLTLPAFRS